MKKSILILVLGLCSLSQAQMDSRTRMQIKPYFPIRCDLAKHNGDKPYLNWQSRIQKVSEDKDFVTFRFVTTYGLCNDGLMERRNINPNFVDLILIKAKLFGKDKGVVQKHLTMISASDVQVEITFDKNFCFKNRNSPEKKQTRVRNYDMLYQPGDYLTQLYFSNNQLYEYRYPIQFPWKLILTEVSMMETTLDVQ